VKSQSDNENASKRPQLKAKMNIKCDGKGMRVEGRVVGRAKPQHPENPKKPG